MGLESMQIADILEQNNSPWARCARVLACTKMMVKAAFDTAEKVSWGKNEVVVQRSWNALAESEMVEVTLSIDNVNSEKITVFLPEYPRMEPCIQDEYVGDCIPTYISSVFLLGWAMKLGFHTRLAIWSGKVQFFDNDTDSFIDLEEYMEDMAMKELRNSAW